MVIFFFQNTIYLYIMNSYRIRKLRLIFFFHVHTHTHEKKNVIMYVCFEFILNIGIPILQFG